MAWVRALCQGPALGPVLAGPGARAKAQARPQLGPGWAWTRAWAAPGLEPCARACPAWAGLACPGLGPELVRDVEAVYFMEKRQDSITCSLEDINRHAEDYQGAISQSKSASERCSGEPLFRTSPSPTTQSQPAHPHRPAQSTDISSSSSYAPHSHDTPNNHNYGKQCPEQVHKYELNVGLKSSTHSSIVYRL